MPKRAELTVRSEEHDARNDAKEAEMAEDALPPAQPVPPPAPAREARRKKPPFWVWLILASCAILVAAIAFATVMLLRPGAAQDSSDASDRPAPAVTTEPSKGEPAEPSTAAPAAIVLPSCEALWPERYARAKQLADGYPEGGIQYNDFGDHRFSEHFGPAAQTALTQVAQMRGCGYPSTLETYTDSYVSELSGAPKDTLISALRSDGDFVESESGAAQVFVWEDPHDGGHWYAGYTVHMFIGDIWVAGYGSDPAADYVPQLTSAIIGANPTLQQ